MASGFGARSMAKLGNPTALISVATRGFRVIAVLDIFYVECLCMYMYIYIYRFRVYVDVYIPHRIIIMVAWKFLSSNSLF